MTFRGRPTCKCKVTTATVCRGRMLMLPEGLLFL